VTAGPGSGKTTVLVERYVHILREHSLSIDQIVAITFTNRAANEMHERLRSELNQMLRIANEEERRRWLNYKRTPRRRSDHDDSRLLRATATRVSDRSARRYRSFSLLDEHRAAIDARIDRRVSSFRVHQQRPHRESLVNSWGWAQSFGSGPTHNSIAKTRGQGARPRKISRSRRRGKHAD
jgi:superfamily I DNA/RNA helicase